MSRLLLAALAVLVPGLALAEAPRVVADIPPVHGLVARVMQGVGEPSLLVRPGASPHGYALKPSEAAALQRAQAVFLVGPELTPWLERPIETLAPGASHVELLAVPGTIAFPTREAATFAPHAHDDAAGHEDGGAAAHPAPGDKHDEHDHAHHDHAHHDHAGHDHASVDPHAWLDPENGKTWTRAIAARLAQIDPPNAAAYAANAEAAVAEIDAAAADTRAALAPLGDLRFVAFHDAYQYFEARFGVAAAGSVTLSDASAPGPGRIAELRDTVAALKVGCALAEPQFDPDLLATVFDGSGVRTAIIDPIGIDIPVGPGFYPALIRRLGDQMQACR